MKFLLVLFVAVAFIATGESLKCYQCITPQSECGDPFDASAKGVIENTCSGSENYCVKATAELSNGTRFAGRSCSTLFDVKSRQASDRAAVFITSQSSYYCNTDLCNGVSATSAALSMLMVIAVPFVFGNHH